MSELVDKVEKLLGTVKFAVIIVLIFAGYLIYGTFVESWHGADYAQRLVYKSIPFMLVQALMFFSIFFATTRRLPIKKRLHGFYVLHLGILLLFLGSVVTYWVGIDGNVTLAPNEAERKIVLNEDRLRMVFHSDGKEVTYALPSVAGPIQINKEFSGIKIKDFLPFAKKEVAWENTGSPTQSSQYFLANENFGETITMSIHPKSAFESNTRLGLLNMHYMPTSLYNCFKKENKAGVMIFNALTAQCFTPDAEFIKVGKTSNDRRFVLLNQGSNNFKFFPDFSPMPVKDDLSLIKNSPWRAFSKSLFEKSPHLFLFGSKIAYFDKADENWVTFEFNDQNKKAILPWMGFELTVLKDTVNQYPTNAFAYTKPIMDGGQTVEGSFKAVTIKVKGQDFQINNEKATTLLIDGKKASFIVDRKTVKLPFELTLKKFNMDKDPGTNNPASYESYVDLFNGTGEKTTNHHIFMNNPLKHDDLTFYQASYFDLGNGVFGSVLSVNLDPGRPIKYLGSILLVFGSIWHFGLMAYRKKKRQTA